jgi:hypothetical protein
MATHEEEHLNAIIDIFTETGKKLGLI